MAALNLSCYNYYYYYHHHSPSPRNVASLPILLSHRTHISFSPISPLTFHHKRLHNNLFVLPTTTTMATNVQQDLPPPLDSTSEPPPVFDGTTRVLDMGLQEKIKLVPIDLKNRPDWYKEKVYPANKVPALEHNNEVKGESLDLIKYINTNFEGPSLYPEDTIKQEFGEELISYTDTFYKSVTTSLKGDGFDDAATAFDYIEKALSKFDDGPFFLGQFSLVDIAYAPFIERFQPYLLDVKNYDIKLGRPKLAAWIEKIRNHIYITRPAFLYRTLIAVVFIIRFKFYDSVTAWDAGTLFGQQYQIVSFGY
ncbi:hypothetical protein M8C21_029228 [Ambrosia artemisiifolia]|uniref:GST N-terminal domain-containing protein n=1 Tax=Ambrosia artemisiifolia TaxID=4212 RepID=A0AAD5GRU8_AMBAR|nr:hypothetical protein M8C21_029228 [Ambrosia artemisiifolia]